MPDASRSLPPCAACGHVLTPADETCPRCGVTAGTEPTVVRATPTHDVIDGKWRIERRLGSGGMGTVMLAHDLELDRKVAIKLLSDNLCEDSELVQRFEREARMMAKLDHPNLVPVYAVGRAGRVPYIVMELLEGCSLGDLLRSRRLELPEVLAITRQMCAGLQFVHSRGVVHRDIKPANVFVALDGHVTLLDLGVARDDSSSLTRSGIVVGTPRYMAPEQILGQRVDHRADLYALATVVYEMLTGQPVFDAESDFSVMQAHIDQPPVSPVKLTSVSAELAEALLAGLEKAPENRYASARDFMEALDRAAVGAPVTHQAPVGPGDPLAVTLPPDIATPLPAATRPRTPAPPSEELEVTAPRRSRSRQIWVALGSVVVTAIIGYALSVASCEPPQPALVAPPPPPPPAAAPAPPPVIEAAPEPVDEPQVAAPLPAKPAAARPRRGPAEVRCTATISGENSWAYVDVDGVRRGATPLKLELPPSPAVTGVTAPLPKQTSRRLLGLGPLIGGAVVGVAGSVLLGLAFTQQQRLVNPAMPALSLTEQKAAVRDGALFQTLGWAGIAVGATALVTGTLLLVLLNRDVEASVSAAASSSGAWVTLSGSWP